MNAYSITRPFPAEIADHVSDLIRASRSAEFFHSDDGATVQCRAHRSEIAAVRRAIRSAKAWAEYDANERAARKRNLHAGVVQAHG